MIFSCWGEFPREVFWLKLIYYEKVVMMKNDCEHVVDASEKDEALIYIHYLCLQQAHPTG